MRHLFNYFLNDARHWQRSPWRKWSFAWSALRMSRQEESSDRESIERYYDALWGAPKIGPRHESGAATALADEQIARNAKIHPPFARWRECDP
jgi:hypothetical protein